MWFVRKITTIITSSWYYTSMSLLTYLWKILNVIWKVKPGYQHYFTVRQPQIYLCKGKSEHRNKDIACRGKRKEEKKLTTGFQPDHALFVKHMQTRSDFHSQSPQRSVKQPAGHKPIRKQQRSMRPDTSLSCWKKTSQIKKKKVGWHINPLSFISIHAHIDLDVSECC